MGVFRALEELDDSAGPGEPQGFDSMVRPGSELADGDAIGTWMRSRDGIACEVDIPPIPAAWPGSLMIKGRCPGSAATSQIASKWP